MSKEQFRELPGLFFNTRQLMRSKVRSSGRSDPNGWMRFETLRFIDGQKEVTMQQVARYLRITAPSATSLIDWLVKRKYVQRKRDTKDKRIARLKLSAAGSRCLEEYLRNAEQLMRDVFSTISATDVSEIVRILRRLEREHRDT